MLDIARAAFVAATAVAIAGAHASNAAADGERSPMFGVALTAAQANRIDAPLMAGAALEGAWWYGRFGFGVEAGMRWDIDRPDDRETTLGGSVRVRVADWLMHSLFERRDVELGIELHAIVEQTWWSGPQPDVDPMSYGGGVAIRLRGTSDYDMSALIAESRFFVRVMTSPRTASAIVDRASSVGDDTRAFTVVLGIGGSFGAGDPEYLAKFRTHIGFDPPYSSL